jgi:AraC family transcriptional regulator of adaptative response / DNA-3-methyladenine glycosylase II
MDGLEMAVRAILGQQISVATARTLAGRITEKFGTPIKTPVPGLTHLFPSPARIAKLNCDELVKLGILRQRSNTLIELAKAIASGNVRLEPGRGAEETCAKVRTIHGIGEWTAQYIAMRALSWPDAFPHSDLGVKKALGLTNAKDIIAAAEKWRPWRAYAVLHLWHGALKAA